MQKNISASELTAFCAKVLTNLDVPKESAETVAKVLVKANLFDIPSHGVARLARYVAEIKKGVTIPTAAPKISAESPVHAVIDAQNGLGHPAANYAMEVAINKAKKSGLSCVTVKNSSHFGIAGYYALKAAQENLIALSMTNAAPLVVPTGGTKAIFGTNPIALAAPRSGHFPFLFDAATSTVSRGKLEVYERNKKQIPRDWAVDENGQPTEDPAQVLKNLINRSGGGLVPLGGHKGFGLAMMVDILCGVLSGSGFGLHVYEKQHAEVGHCFLVIDTEKFLPLTEFKTRLEDLVSQIKSNPQPDGIVHIAGEQSFQSEQEQLKNGVILSDPVKKSLTEVGNNTGVKFTISQ